MHDLILAIARYLRPLDHLLRVEELHAYLVDEKPLDIDEALGLLDEAHLIRTTFRRDSLQLTPEGREAVDDGCVLDLVFGPTYIDQRCSQATVHIIVLGQNNDESGGTGFFSADYPGWIVTADHVIRDREVLRIEDLNGNVVSRGPFQTRLSQNSLDIAMVSCPLPEAVAPLKIEWRRDFLRPMQQLVILGYPPYPNHLPALHHSRAELHAVTMKLGTAFLSLIIASVTRPGFSGGPVINERGRVIGIVEQENIGENVHLHPLAYFSAVPASYCRDLAMPE